MRRLSTRASSPTTPSSIACGHCLHRAPMSVVFAVGTPDREELGGMRHGETRWEVLTCGECARLSLRSGHSSPDDPEPFSWDVVYPPAPDTPRFLPSDISRAHKAAMLMRTVDAHAYAVLLGTLLEIICLDRGARGQNLYYRLRDLAARSLIPATLAECAHGITDLRPAFVVARTPDLTAGDIALLEPLSEALLQYLYVAPALTAAAVRAGAPEE